VGFHRRPAVTGASHASAQTGARPAARLHAEQIEFRRDNRRSVCSRLNWPIGSCFSSWTMAKIWSSGAMTSTESSPEQRQSAISQDGGLAQGCTRVRVAYQTDGERRSVGEREPMSVMSAMWSRGGPASSA
jgi:hypothetical protein